ncbi:hypothetical protein GIW57_17895 [Stenotrophomonas sp. PA-6-5C]|uniref:hypothetical protein n=1 Tax=Stenotrophomonas sp. PA-6-5C TaxID=2665487 RepID=UPI001F3324F5|nr:hypothetical protein [Stenotrophomonas sp. PA-6-5C]MCF5092029.1 hypothetical protein [Stenotrophomonas sp. PA-6-5C]
MGTQTFYYTKKCSERESKATPFFPPSGSVRCMNGCESVFRDNGDDTTTYSPNGKTCDRKPDCDAQGKNMVWNAMLGVCQPVEPECPEGKVKVGNACADEKPCPDGMALVAGSCKKKDEECPAGMIRSPLGSCIPGDGQCAQGEVRGPDGTCKRDSNNDGEPDPQDKDDPETFSGGDTCSAPPSCSGSPIMCGQARIQWRIECNTRRNNNITVTRKVLPKRPMGTYKSTELDTTERRIPWYFFALPIVLVVGLALSYFAFGRMGSRLTGDDALPTPAQASNGPLARDGALATAGASGSVAKRVPLEEYVKNYLPRIASQPWSAPVYDSANNLPSEPPRLFCMSSLGGENGLGQHDEPSCSCVTEQGTGYDLDEPTCRYIARRGQYEPYLPRRENRFVDGGTQINRNMQDLNERSIQGASIARGDRAMGTFPETPSIQTSSYTQAGENRL